MLQSLFTSSQNIPSDPNSGFRLGGGGTFNVTAGSLDLGATAGLVSEGPAENAALANYFTRGADINVSVGGDLNMFSTTISCLNGGNISVAAGGNINLGSTYFTANDAFARGIFSTCDSSVSVVAGGDININGSRIAGGVAFTRPVFIAVADFQIVIGCFHAELVFSRFHSFQKCFAVFVDTSHHHRCCFVQRLSFWLLHVIAFYQLLQIVFAISIKAFTIWFLNVAMDVVFCVDSEINQHHDRKACESV